MLSNLKTSTDPRSRNHSSSTTNSINSSRSIGKPDSSTRASSSGIRLTGDPQTDEDIMAFMKARQELMNKSKCKLISW